MEEEEEVEEKGCGGSCAGEPAQAVCACGASFSREDGCAKNSAPVRARYGQAFRAGKRNDLKIVCFSGE